MKQESRQSMARRAQKEFRAIGGEIHSLEEALVLTRKILGESPSHNDCVGIANTVFRSYMVTIMRRNGLDSIALHFENHRTSCNQIRHLLGDVVKRRPGDVLSQEIRAALKAFELKNIEDQFHN